MSFKSTLKFLNELQDSEDPLPGTLLMEYERSMCIHLSHRLMQSRKRVGHGEVLTKIEGLFLTDPSLGLSDEEYSMARKRRGEAWFQSVVQEQVTKARKYLSAGCPELERLELLRRQFSLSPLAVSILGLSYLIQISEQFNAILRADGWSPHGSSVLQGFVLRASVMLNVSVKEILAELTAEAHLRRQGLLDIDDFTLPQELLEYLQGLCSKPLQSVFYTACEGQGRRFDDYGDLAESLSACVHLFRRAKLDGKGAVVTFHGVAGTGKSTAVKAIANEAGLSAWEILRLPGRSEKEAGFRWRAMAAAIASLDPATTLLVVDEADELDEDSAKGKSILTELLDRSSHCWIFVGNQRPFSHEALLRRTSFDVKFPQPDESLRKRLWKDIGLEHGIELEEELVQELAKRFVLAPGSMHTICRDGVRISREKSEPVFQVLMEVAKLHAKGLGAAVSSRKDGPAWREDCINVEGGISCALEQMRSFASRQAKLDPSLPLSQLCVLFSGPPGTGKTELARRLAKELGRKLVVHSAASILGSFVGETERNIQAAFREASGTRSVLFLDEIDSILRDRSGAQQTWEVSQVNQLLQEMEAFEGIFIAATNSVQSLDNAAARRFQIKLEFKYLDPSQRISLWESQIGPLLGDTRVPEELSRMNTLTPGDFRVIWSQICLERVPPTVDMVLERFMKELANRKHLGRRLGL